MTKIKKRKLAILTLSSGLATAGTMGAVCVPGSVTIPSLEQHGTLVFKRSI